MMHGKVHFGESAITIEHTRQKVGPDGQPLFDKNGTPVMETLVDPGFTKTALGENSACIRKEI